MPSQVLCSLVLLGCKTSWELAERVVNNWNFEICFVCYSTISPAVHLNELLGLLVIQAFTIHSSITQWLNRTTPLSNIHKFCIMFPEKTSIVKVIQFYILIAFGLTFLISLSLFLSHRWLNIWQIIVLKSGSYSCTMFDLVIGSIPQKETVYFLFNYF